MNHKIKQHKMGRSPSHRRATLRNMATALFTHGQITTTVPKAKALQPYVERLVHTAKKGTLHARRQIIQTIGDPIAVQHEDDDELVRNRYGEIINGPRVVTKLVEEIAPEYTDREGGYTRIVKLATHRIGDGADLCVIQLVGGEEEQGPQVAGQHSRRREKANKRMQYAAQLRKRQTVAAEQETAQAQQAEQADESATATAEPEAEAESAAEETTPESEAQSDQDKQS